MRGWTFTLLTSAIAFSGIMYFLLGGQPPVERPGEAAVAPEQVLESRKVVRDVTPSEVLQAPRIEGALLERLPAVQPAPPPEAPAEPVRWKRPTTPAAGVIAVGDTRIELAGIRPLAIDATCNLRGGASWPCGRFARTAFRNFLRGRTLDCEPTTTGTGQARLMTRCNLGGRDLSAWLVRTGWAEPAGELFKEELRLAREEKRGQWRESAP